MGLFYGAKGKPHLWGFFTELKASPIYGAYLNSPGIYAGVGNWFLMSG